jgi:hypothetical protein
LVEIEYNDQKSMIEVVKCNDQAVI